MDLEAIEGDFCDCFFNKTEVKENGGWEKDDDSDMAAHKRDAIRCLQNCKNQFLETVSADYSKTFISVCSKLTTKGPNQNLWPLYWCDSTLCGVWINQTGTTQQDPNVDWIINECNSLEYRSVRDPGPPPPNYTCITDANKADGSVGLCTNIQLPAQTSSAATGNPAPTATTHTSTRESPILATQSGEPTRATASGNAPIAAETNPGSANSPSISTTAPTPDTELTPGTRVAIALSSALGLLLLACLAWFLLRRRHKQRDSTLPSSIKNRIRYTRDFPPPGSPTTPLIPSPTTTRPPLTPPLRLRDRKFLPSILRQSRSPSPPLTPLTPVHLPPHAAAVFPSSPICSPTTNRLVPRHERTPKIYGASTSSQPPSTPPASPPPLPPLPPVPAYFHDRGSLGSSASTFAPSTKSTISTGGNHSISLSSLRNETVSLLSLPHPPPPPPPPTSPTRPPRPHEAPLVIPDLVSPASPTASASSPTMVVSTPTSPAGPPPNRALPARPVQTQTPVIVVDGASPSPSPELPAGPGRSQGELSGGGWVGQKILHRGRGREREVGMEGMTVDLDLGGGRR
ncbi:hypothetical protein CONLIGDRAFT_424688 [Coniochaeta ligniaria NRRL 30616]|uniref:Uncharacterized protein n=1 Tax=Coniochaeta ligniaria NRRL 30616 TaxID=1408157 RepID=A0A1J7IHW3_9PEZI|nr:hypothetical protein CONLIGDRAFT_424688 [Coniochaeta ligniaria NRRL 30616]